MWNQWKLENWERGRNRVLLCACVPVLSIICQAAGFPETKGARQEPSPLVRLCAGFIYYLSSYGVSRDKRSAVGTESSCVPLCRFYLLFVKLGVSRDERSVAGI